MDSDRFAERIDAYLDDDLTAEEIADLERQLLADDAQLRQFAREAFLHRQLRSFLLARSDSECLQESADSTVPSSSAPASPTLFAYLNELLRGDGSSTTHFWLVGVAIALLTIGAAGLWLRGGLASNSPKQQEIVANEGDATQLETGKANPDSVVGDAIPFARVTRMWRPQWSDSNRSLNEWAALGKGDLVDLKSGQVELYFEAGAQLVLQGPVRFEVLGPKLGRVFHGDLTARVGEHAKGFSLITSAGKIIDLGTEFGVSVQPDGETDVVVFDGTVDFELPIKEPSENYADMPDSSPGTILSRLTTGEAVRVKPDGSTRRIVAINSDRFSWAATGIAAQRAKPVVISSVSDTIRTPGACTFYEIVHGGLGEDVRAYVDRPHEWNGIDEKGIPEFLRGADYLKTFNDDKRRGSYELTVELAQPADLYVLWDDRVKVPGWLKEQFTNTDLKIGLDEAAFRYSTNQKLQIPTYSTAEGAGNSVDRSYSIWRRRVLTAGDVTLGSAKTSRRSRVAMYGVAAVAVDDAQPKGTNERP
jgi:hypothetical protein